MAVVLDTQTRLTNRQRLVVAAIALAVLALTALRPTPEVGTDVGDGDRPFVAEQPSLTADR